MKVSNLSSSDADGLGNLNETGQILTSQLPATINNYGDSKIGNRTGIAVASVGTNAYIFGGRNSNGADPNSKKIYSYNGTSFVSLTAQLPTPRADATAVAIGTKIYIFGGRNSNNILDEILVFDTATPNVSPTVYATLPVKLYGAKLVAKGNFIFIVGGITFDSSGTNEIANTRIMTFNVGPKTFSPANTSLNGYVNFKPYTFLGTSDTVRNLDQIPGIGLDKKNRIHIFTNMKGDFVLDEGLLTLSPFSAVDPDWGFLKSIPLPNGLNAPWQYELYGSVPVQCGTEGSLYLLGGYHAHASTNTGQPPTAYVTTNFFLTKMWYY